MPRKTLSLWKRLSLEERILNCASLFTVICIAFPWISGSWLGGDEMAYSGLQFYTSYIGIFIGLSHIVILCQTLIPSLRESHMRETLILWLAACSTVLALAALTVLINIATEFTSMDVRMGIYGTLIGSMVSTMYAWWISHQSGVGGSFHRPRPARIEPPLNVEPLMPPPPLPPEDHIR